MVTFLVILPVRFVAEVCYHSKLVSKQFFKVRMYFPL